MNDLVSLIGVLVGGGGIGAVIVAYIRKPVTKAEGREVEVRGELQIIGAATQIVGELREELRRLSLRVEALERENINLRSENARLLQNQIQLEEELKHLQGG